MSEPADIATLTFEQALAELAQIVARRESGVVQFRIDALFGQRDISIPLRQSFWSQFRRGEEG